MDVQLNHDDEFHCVVRHITHLASFEFSPLLCSFTYVFLLLNMLSGDWYNKGQHMPAPAREAQVCQGTFGYYQQTYSYTCNTRVTGVSVVYVNNKTRLGLEQINGLG